MSNKYDSDEDSQLASRIDQDDDMTTTKSFTAQVKKANKIKKIVMNAKEYQDKIEKLNQANTRIVMRQEMNKGKGFAILSQLHKNNAEKMKINMAYGGLKTGDTAGV